MPNLDVIRPADANEVAEAWRMAINRTDGPTALILTRQNLPILDRTKYAPASGTARGAYALADPADGAAPRLIIIASGSEVHLALAAQDRLAAEGIPARVVNMPCQEAFERQPTEYRNEVLPPSIGARIVVEAGATFGWERYTCEKGDIIGIDRFGASAPGNVVMEKLGFSVDNVVSKAKAVLGI
jgi:transketolase